MSMLPKLKRERIASVTSPAIIARSVAPLVVVQRYQLGVVIDSAGKTLGADPRTLSGMEDVGLAENERCALWMSEDITKETGV